jgi:hypothetical protein
MNELLKYCLICGAPADDVGPNAILGSVCPFVPFLAEDEVDEPAAWEKANCLDELLEEADVRAWMEERERKIAAGEVAIIEPPPGLVQAMERIRAEFQLSEESPVA